MGRHKCNPFDRKCVENATPSSENAHLTRVGRQKCNPFDRTCDPFVNKCPPSSLLQWAITWANTWGVKNATPSSIQHVCTYNCHRFIAYNAASDRYDGWLYCGKLTLASRRPGIGSFRLCLKPTLGSRWPRHGSFRLRLKPTLGCRCPGHNSFRLCLKPR